MKSAIYHIVVKRCNGEKWKCKMMCMCVNYMDLNKVCPKDTYPLSNINKLVDGTVVH